MVLGAVAAVVLLGRRHVHPLLALVWPVLVVVALWPVAVLAVAVETVRGQHRRWCSWPRTAALVATWAAVGGLVYLWPATVSDPWPLLAVPAAVLAWDPIGRITG